MHNQKIQLSYENFNSVASHTFKEVFDDITFSDVTFATEDGKNPSSDMFRNILVRGVQSALLDQVVKLI